MNTKFSILLLGLLGLVVAAGGCSTGATGSDADSTDFAPGAFPPTLTDMDYHSDAWNKDVDKCMVCHRTGVQGAPVIEHKSLPPEAKEAKCASCHVFIRGSKPNL